jgi:hypothetical protein
MKRYIIIGALLVSAAFAQAELGDNYAQSCKRFNGSRGTVSKDWIYYSHWNDHQVDYWCQFRSNHCVAIEYAAPTDSQIIDSEVWRLLLVNSKGVTWNEYSVTSTGTHCYVSADGLMFASLTESKRSLLVAYKDWWDRHHMWNEPSENGQPPVEEGNTAPSGTPPERKQQLGKGDNV